MFEEFVMIKMLTAYTEEIDDANIAVEEIQQQLGDKLLSNSVGIIHCFADFAESGVLEAICKSLPFNTVGCSTTSSSVHGMTSAMALTISVLTSDDINFACGMSDVIADNIDKPIEELYGTLSSGGKNPTLILTYIPYTINYGGDDFIEKITKCSDGVPMFGTIACSNYASKKDSKSFTVCNGTTSHSSLVLLFIIGDIKPEFHSVSVIEEDIFEEKSVVTKSNKNVLQEINGISALKYFEDKGLVENKIITGFQTMPLILYLEDGSRLLRAAVNINEAGEIVLGGTIPPNSKMGIAEINSEGIISMAKKFSAEIQQRYKGRSMLCYCCVARTWVLVGRFLDEYKAVSSNILDIPYLMAASNGEVFPEKKRKGQLVNQLYNYTLIACVL
jgi:hypothetical protein